MPDSSVRNDEERLNEPGRRTPSLFPRFKFTDDTFGQLAEWIARLMGSPAFIIGMTAFIIAWILLNRALLNPFDDWPFVGLTLMLSIEAAYSAPLILLAQNRQEDRDRLSLNEDRRVSAQSRADMDFLAREIASVRQRVGEVATRDFVRGEIRDQLEELLTEIKKLDEAPAPATEALQD